MKKLYLVLCMVISILAFSACGNSTEVSSTINKETAEAAAQDLFKQWCELDLSYLENEEYYNQSVSQYGEEFVAQMETWSNTKKEIGDYKETLETTVQEQEGKPVVTIKAMFTNETLLFKIFLTSNNEMSSISLDIYKTLGEKMVDAALNTIMGMSIVFLVLIFISLIISLFKYIPMLMERKKKEEVAVVETPSMEEFVEEEELVDDTELVAVITAAIMASMGDEAPSDGLVVRSIRKVNKKWKNA